MIARLAAVLSCVSLAVVATAGGGLSPDPAQAEAASPAALGAEGAVRLVGDDAYAVPEAALTGVTQVARSNKRVYALKENGQLLYWNYPGGTLSSLSGPYTQISAQNIGMLALRTNGTLELLLDNGYHNASLASSVTQAAQGFVHYVYRRGSLVVDSRGGGVAPDNRGYDQVAAANDVFAAMGGGTVVAWTVDGYLHRVDLPVPSEAQSGVLAIAGGGDTLAALKDGSVIAWRVDGSPIALSQPANTGIAQVVVGDVPDGLCAVFGLREDAVAVDLCTGGVVGKGVYGVARNGAATALLVKPHEPGQVRNLSAVPVSGSVDLRWEAPVDDGNLPLAYYRVRYRPAGVAGSVWTERDVLPGGADTRTSLNGIGNDAIEIQVVAANRLYFGQPVSVVSTTVAAPDAPANVNLVSGRGSVLLSWSPPGSFGGAPADGYDVSASAGESCGHVYALSCRIKGLADGQQVEVAIRARNAVNTSMPVRVTGSAEPLVSSQLQMSNDNPIRLFKGQRLVLKARYIWEYPSGPATAPDGSAVELQRGESGGRWRHVRTLRTVNGEVSTSSVASSGKWRFRAIAPNGRQATSTQRVVALSNPRLTIRLSTNKGRWGSTTGVAGRLIGKDQRGKRSTPTAGQEVHVQFRPASSSPWKTVKRLMTDPGGSLRTRVPLRSTGQWRLMAPRLAVSDTRRALVKPKFSMIVEWPSRISGSWRLPVETTRNGRPMSSTVVLQYRPSNFGAWEPVDFVRTGTDGSGSLLVAWGNAGYYRVCASRISKCEYMSYA